MKAIFEQGVATRRATFETEAPSWEDWDGAHLPLRLVAEEDGDVLGWAALVPYSSRECYRCVAESSVYVTERAVFRRERDGLVLTEVAPGLDVRKDVLAHVEFPVRVSPGLRPMPADLFLAE